MIELLADPFSPKFVLWLAFTIFSIGVGIGIIATLYDFRYCRLVVYLGNDGCRMYARTRSGRILPLSVHPAFTALLDELIAKKRGGLR